MAALLADFSLETLGELLLIPEKLHAACPFCGILQVRDGEVCQSVGDVVADGAGKHSGVLVD
jgi:hypothetical protein